MLRVLSCRQNPIFLLFKVYSLSVMHNFLKRNYKLFAKINEVLWQPVYLKQIGGGAGAG